MIYLDNASTTMIDPVVLEEMMPYLKEEYGNAGTPHPLGARAHDAVAKARRQVANMLNASPGQIIFTSGGSEANNTALKTCMYDGIYENKHTMLVSAIEHSSVLNTANFLHMKYGFEVHKLPVNSFGIVKLSDYLLLLDKYVDDIALISVMMTNNEVGSTNNIRALSTECQERGIKFHCDCVQAAGYHDIDVEALGCDFISLSSHKIHGPKGVGALYVKDREALVPLIHGGANQEFGCRGGTENVAGIVGFGKACEIYTHEAKAIREKIDGLKKRFVIALTKAMNDREMAEHLHFNARSDFSKGKVLSVRIDGIDAETMVLALGANGICVSSGSACRSYEQEPSYVLQAVGLSAEGARDTIRVSFSRMNTESEVDQAVKTIADTALFLYNRYRTH